MKFTAKTVLILSLALTVYGLEYGDQRAFWYTADFWPVAENINSIQLKADGSGVELVEGAIYGSIDLPIQISDEPFDRLLASWNGWSPEDGSSFRVQVRFPYGDGWSPWLTVGYWQDQVFPNYGSTSYGGGFIDYDYAVLNNYVSQYQLRLSMRRTQATHPSPTVHKLAVFTSDHRTTDNLSLGAIIDDDPPEIFIPTTFVCQYNVDPEIGGSICSPTSVVLILRSYDMEVDAYQFALDNFDPYWGIFGIWPRAVQNGAQQGLDGELRRYRTWSAAYDILAAGGRIAMSVGPPLYSGHLMMLAGFNQYGTPIVHDPARQNGYSYMFSKSALSASWFDKGGVGYTFFPLDTTATSLADAPVSPGTMALYQNYPNPFNAETNIRFEILRETEIQLTLTDLKGRQLEILDQGVRSAGGYTYHLNADHYPAGIYLISLQADGLQATRKITLLK